MSRDARQTYIDALTGKYPMAWLQQVQSMGQPRLAATAAQEAARLKERFVLAAMG
jgi:hypothetical protein